jgi:hypothetical protein
MGEVEAKKDRVTRHEFRHDRHTASLLTNHIVFSLKYRGVLRKKSLGKLAKSSILNSKTVTLLVIPNFFMLTKKSLKSALEKGVELSTRKGGKP